MKMCKRCNVMSEYSNFLKHPRHGDGYKNICKNCRDAYLSEWKKQNSEKDKGYKKKYVEKLRIKRMSEGLCCNCNEKKLENSVLCLKHWFDQKANIHLGSTSKGYLLKELAEKQNYKCVYTGELLIPSINMSLDHIIAHSKKVEFKKDINNLQWVTRLINTQKNNLSHERFISLCKTIHFNFNTNIL